MRGVDAVMRKTTRSTEYGITKDWRKSPDVWKVAFWFFFWTFAIAFTIGVLVGVHVAGAR